MHAGVGVVQFATNPTRTCSYVIKCFPSQAALDHEYALHAHEALKPLLPPLVTRCNEGEASEGGIFLPPIIVTEGGETLENVFSSRRPQLFHTVEVRKNTSVCFHSKVSFLYIR